MTQSGNENYLANFSDAERAFFTGIPAWAVVFWAVSVFCATLGALSLLMRKRWAAPLFAIALISFLVVAFQNHWLANPTMAEAVGPFSTVFSLVIFIVTLGLWLYARRMVARGVLT